MRAMEREDRAVRSTNDEATVGKWCAVHKGYYEDAFVECFLAHAPVAFHPPLMNRGHFARVMAVELALLRFVSHIDGALHLEWHRFFSFLSFFLNRKPQRIAEEETSGIAGLWV